MSHYSIRKSCYKDADALVAALKKCGVPADAIGVSEDKSGVVVSSARTGTYLSTVFVLATATNSESSIKDDPYNWPKTLVGVNNVATADAWTTKVRMEYDYEIQRKKAALLGQRIQRIDQNGKIYAVIKA